MSAIAKWLIKENSLVSGSDINKNDMFIELENLGVKIFIGHAKENILSNDIDLVIYNSAINEENIELKTAKELNIPIVKRSEFLGGIINLYKNKIGISGCHGKTTVTAMLTHVFDKEGLNPTSFIGGEDNVYSNFLGGDRNFIIFEACEFKKNFLDFNSDLAVVLNMDNDHLDSYSSFDEIVKTYNEFSKNALLIYNADDKNCLKLQNQSFISFGIENKCMYMAENLKEKEGKYSFNLYEYGRNLGRICLNIVGKHNVYNALATIAVARKYQISFDKIKKALKEFTGVKRRNEFLGEFNGKKIYADYAHHPTEIKAVLKSINQDFLIVFQPHTYSRTKNLMQDFVEAFKEVENLIIYSTYSAREEYQKEGSAFSLYEHLNKKVLYADNKDNLKDLIINCNKKSVMFLGAGDIYDIAKEIVKK